MQEASERRSTPRNRTIQGGKIVYGDFRFLVDCVIRDISSSGARLKVEDPSEVPETFHLYDYKHQRLIPAEAVWRSEREVGVRFVGEPINIFESKDHRLARFKFM